MKRIAVDIDGIICNNTGGKRHQAQPNVESIQKVNELADKGVTIIMFSARPWSEYDLTKRQLDEWGVQYDELILGKPQVDFVVDDRSCQTVEQLCLQMAMAEDGRYKIDPNRNNDNIQTLFCTKCGQPAREQHWTVDNSWPLCDCCINATCSY